MKFIKKIAILVLIFISILVLFVWQVGQKRDTQVGPAPAISRNLLSKSKDSGKKTVKSAKNSHALEILLHKLTSKLVCNVEMEHEQGKNTVIDGDIPGMNRTKRTGYVIALHFHEQQTKASENLFTLQCWAKTMFVNIVEPYVQNSHLAIPLNSSQKMLPRYRDLFDIGVWKLLSAQHKLAPLASWDNFIAKAPRELIVARFRYLSSRRVKNQNGNGKKKLNLHLALTSKYKQGCKTSSDLSQKIEYLKVLHGFTVVRDVCFNFAKGDELTLFQFNQHLYERYGPKTVTVLMEEWRGLNSMESKKRVSMFDACWLPTYVQPVAYTWPSQQLICDAKRYTKKYLRTDDDYISLMVRTEKFDNTNITNKPETIAKCLNETLKEWRNMKDFAETQRTFLSMDIGTYGSYSLVQGKNYHLYTNLYEKFIRELFGPRATIRSWEMGFEEIASSLDSGYIGSLQKTIAAKSKCIIFTGGGTFQKYTTYIYNRINKGKCIKFIQNC